MRPYQKIRKQLSPHMGTDGFSLIESVIVIAIFSIAVLAAMSMHLSASKSNSNSRKVTMAMEYATDTMERLMQIPGSFDYYNVDDDGNGTIDDAGEQFLDSDGEDNDGDGTIDNAAELEWHRTPAFFTADTNVGTTSTGFTRGVTDPRIPEDQYYSQMFNLTWDVTNIDSDGDGDSDSKQIDITVRFVNGNKFIELSGLRNNLF